MKIRREWFIFVLCFSASFTCAAASSACPTSKAAFVEEQLPKLATWDQFSTFYRKYKKCDVSALRYAYTQQIAHLTANDRGLTSLSKTLVKHPRLKPLILQHLKSETVTANDRDQILKNLNYCQTVRIQICRDVRNALNAT
jgi:hypothetical protein